MLVSVRQKARILHKSQYHDFFVYIGMYDLSESKVDLQVSLTIHSFMTFKILFKPFDPEKRPKHKKAKLDIFKSYNI